MADIRQTEPQIEVPPVQVNYPSIEKLIESEDFDQLNKNFIKAYGELEKIAGKKGISKSKQGAKKAMLALERTMDLLTELLRIKYKLAGQGSGEERPQEKK